MNPTSKTTYKTGVVAVIGRPNVGKSTLLNQLVGAKLAPVSPKAQTTRKKLLGIRSTEKSQIVFIDTPGIHKTAPSEMLNAAIVSEANQSLDGVDAILYMLDGSRILKFDAESDDGIAFHMIRKALKKKNVPLIVAINKTDLKAQGGQIKDLQGPIKEFLQDFEPKSIIPISAKLDRGLEHLITILEEVLPAGEASFPLDDLTNEPVRNIVANLIHENLFYCLGEEIPYSCAVEIEDFKDPVDLQRFPEIRAAIHVEKDSQKPIVIGKGAAKIKEISEKSRKSIEELLDTKVVLKIFVKVTPKWSRNKESLKQLGFVVT